MYRANFAEGYINALRSARMVFGVKILRLMFPASRTVSHHR